jgi:hypothetical protein
MAAPAGTFQVYQSVGNREDLEDVIYSISPTDTPFVSMIGRGKAKAVYHEWQTDALAAASATNAAIEGDDATILTATPTVRLGNYCQILTKAISISGTQETINKAGRKSELAYQIAKRGKELKRDLEAVSSQNKGSTTGAAASARAMASLESWLFTNRTDLGTGGNNTTPGFISGIVAAPTDASVAVTFTKAALDTVIQACWTAGGDPSKILVGPYNKTKASGFTGISTLYKEINGMKQGVITSGVDTYVSNFGEHFIVPSRFNRDKTVCVIDPEYWELAYLRPFQQFELAKTGDSERRQMLCEVTLVSKNEAASGKITSLATTN